jgi:RNA polymerase sigma-70 factor (ECF subfamily)
VDGTVALAKRGDRDAFAALYRRFRPLVRGVLLARLSAADADDVTQEVFVKAHGKLSALKEDGALGAWLCAIARTSAIDFIRKREAAAGAASTKAVSLDDSGKHPAAREPGGADVAEAKRVLAAIQELPEAYREPLVLRLVEGMTGPEIAKETGMTDGSVRVNLHRGMALLKARLGA